MSVDESVRLADQVLPDAGRWASRPVILPIGSTEQHGPALPYGTDTMIAAALAERVAAEIGGIVLPPLSYGYRSAPNSGGGPLFVGTIDLSGTTLIHLVRDILVELLRDGMHHVLIVNAHFENTAFIQEGVHLALDHAAATGETRVLCTNWWDPLSEEAMAEAFEGIGFPGWDLEHAGVTETSLLLEIAPHLVRHDAIATTAVEFAPPAVLRMPTRHGDVPGQGNLSSAVGASAARGRVILAHATAAISQAWYHEFPAPAREGARP